MTERPIKMAVSDRISRKSVSPVSIGGEADLRLDEHVFYMFSRILALRNRQLNSDLARHGIDFPRWRVLAVLNEHPGCSMLKLAEHTSVDRTSLAHTVNLMVGEGLVERAERKSDRRSVALDLSARGRRTLRLILPLVVAQNEAALAGFTSREGDQFLSLLRRVLGNLS